MRLSVAYVSKTSDTFKRVLLVMLCFSFTKIFAQYYIDSTYTIPFGTNSVLINKYQELITIGLAVVNNSNRYGVLKIDSAGVEVSTSTWHQPYKANYAGYAGSISQRNSRYYHTGWSVDTTYLWRGVFTIWDENLNLILERDLGYQDSSSLFFSHLNNLNKIICTGMNWLNQGNDNNQSQLLLMQLDTLGNKIWECSYKAKSGLWHLQGNSIISTQDGGYAIAGNAYNYAVYPSYTSYVMITDSLGNKIVDRYLKYKDFGSYSMGIQQKTNGNFLVAYGTTYLSDARSEHLSRKLIIEELDKNDLSTVWQKEYLQGYVNGLVVSRLIVQNDSTFLIGGYYKPEEVLYQGEFASQLGYIFAITEYGDSLWYRDYLNGTDKYEYNYLNDIAITPDGGIVGAGRLETSNSPYTGGLASHVWLFKTDSIGCLQPGCDTVYQKPKAPVTEFKVYPNPAQAGQNLIIELPGGTSAEAVLYNAIGQMVFKSELEFSAGLAYLSVISGRPGGVGTGIYMLHIQTPNGKNYVEKLVFY